MKNLDYMENKIQKFLNLINKIKTNKTTKDVLQQLTYFCLAKGEAYPSHKTLARLTGKSVRTVQYSLEKLEEMDLISRTNRSYLKTKIYHINFQKLQALGTFQQGKSKKISPEVACEVAHKKKINNKLIIAKALDENLEKMEGKGACATLDQPKDCMIDLSQTIPQDILETIVQDVNTTAEKSFSKNYFLKSINKLKEIDLKKGKSIVVSLKTLIKRLVGWVKRELITSEEAVSLESPPPQQLDVIQTPEDLSNDLQTVCHQTQGNHPQKIDIIQTLKSTFERFDCALRFKSWFKNLSIEEGEGGAALLKWPSAFDRDWVKNNCGSELRYAFAHLGMGYELGE